ncbi:IS5 family transposase [Corallococcus exiguus]|nr:IS5 family transposase [Corallococcus exiguus]
MEVRVQPLQQLVEARRVGAALQGSAARVESSRAGGRSVHPRWHHHPGASGRRGRKRGVQHNALGRSRGGFSTKVHALVDSRGRPRHIELTPGQRHEMTKADDLIMHAVGAACIADSGYDADWFRALLKFFGMKAVIASKPERPRALSKDRKLYALRYLVERFFHGLKRFRRLATRYEKTARNYLALIHLACTRMWLN